MTQLVLDPKLLFRLRQSFVLGSPFYIGFNCVRRVRLFLKDLNKTKSKFHLESSTFLVSCTYLKVWLFCTPLAFAVATNEVLGSVMGRFPCDFDRTVVINSYWICSSFALILIADDALHNVLTSSIISIRWLKIKTFDLLYCFGSFGCFDQRDTLEGYDGLILADIRCYRMVSHLKCRKRSVFLAGYHPWWILRNRIDLFLLDPLFLCIDLALRFES